MHFKSESLTRQLCHWQSQVCQTTFQSYDKRELSLRELVPVAATVNLLVAMEEKLNFFHSLCSLFEAYKRSKRRICSYRF